jgi:7-keto-8-aminopelargonate synthetase-like enzyme
LNGTLELHLELEAELAAFLGRRRRNFLDGRFRATSA